MRSRRARPSQWILAIVGFAAAVLVAFALVPAAGGAPAPGAKVVAIAVTPTMPSVAAGRTIQLNATGHYDDGSTQDLTRGVRWASSDKKVANVSNKAASEGLATGRAAGTTTISATVAGLSGSTTLTVTDAEL